MRLFVAVDIAPSVRAELTALINRWKVAEPHARWLRAEGIHVTIKFLGETREELIPEIVRALEVVRSPSPVGIRVRGVGFFPNARRPRVLWAGVEGSPNLAELAQAVESAVEPSGFPCEARTFQPHLTLARLPEGRKWDALVRAGAELAAREFGSYRESEFHLLQSFLKPTGAEYKKLATFAFFKETA
ncbi:MAG TPA: RNA 2',3'-cyclic phosphodiesterase [Candidatus Acidoferrum sp.]|nr:RNA 2',3'-cyclic phosphodiesterase [Candidatus Acidoferrum sp.]